MNFVRVELNRRIFKKRNNQLEETQHHDKANLNLYKLKAEQSRSTENKRSASEHSKNNRHRCKCGNCFKCRTFSCRLSFLNRSEVMYLCQLFMDKDALFPTIAELGNLGLVQFEQQSLNGKYENQIQMCSTVEKTLHKYIELLHATKLTTTPNNDFIEPIIPNSASELDRIYHDVAEMDSAYQRLVKDIKPLVDSYNESSEYLAALHRFMVFMDDANNFEVRKKSETDIERAMFEDFKAVGIMIGTIRRQKLLHFETALWRFCHQAHLFQGQDMDDNELHETKLSNTQKSTFFVVFVGDKIGTKIEKFCKSYDTSTFYCPNDSMERKILFHELRERKANLQRVIVESEAARRSILLQNADRLQPLLSKIIVLKSIFVVCNSLRLDATRNVYVAEMWIPRKHVKHVQIALNTATLKGGYTVLPMLVRIKMNKMPPTCYMRNKFIQGFQNIIDAYGFAMYREISPAPFTVVTFPFLFAVMFGDIGHGLLILAAAIYLISIEGRWERRKIRNEMFGIIFAGRYIILMLGLFSVYSGALYNEVFGKPAYNIGSQWSLKKISLEKKKVVNIETVGSFTGTPVPFGIDMIWGVATNKIIVSNSFKMKISIIFGVLQMSFGLLLKGCNASYFKNRISILLEVLPMALFLLCLFGYLTLLIFIKWTTYSALNPPATDETCAPSILITFIDMVMFKKSDKLPDYCRESMFPHQKVVQMMLVCVALLSVPLLLLGRPLQLWYQKMKTKRQAKQSVGLEEKAAVALGREKSSSIMSIKSLSAPEVDLSSVTYIPADLKEQPNKMAEVMIYQGIHTIDSVIGSVSHTASYLRLWALSLAHSQMSEVMWRMILDVALTMAHKSSRFWNVFALVFIFPIWAFFSFVILVVMEGLSIFLHTTRLHWVEFQSKFYYGSGRPFLPFSFKRILNES